MPRISQTFSPHHKQLSVTWRLKSEMITSFHELAEGSGNVLNDAELICERVDALWQQDSSSVVLFATFCLESVEFQCRLLISLSNTIKHNTSYSGCPRLNKHTHHHAGCVDRVNQMEKDLFILITACFYNILISFTWSSHPVFIFTASVKCFFSPGLSLIHYNSLGQQRIHDLLMENVITE